MYVGNILFGLANMINEAAKESPKSDSNLSKGVDDESAGGSLVFSILTWLLTIYYVYIIYKFNEHV